MKSILITGCSTGIGLDAAETLKQLGWRVFATARQHRDVEKLQAAGFEAHVLDTTDSASIRQAVEWVQGASGGRLDALYNNAGLGVPGACSDISRDALRHQFETNFFGAVELTNLLLPAMLDAGHGRIVFNSSVLGFAAMPMRGAYNASKFAMEGWVDTLRLELAGTGVHAVLIEPGPIRSAFRKNAEREFVRWVEPQQSGRYQQRYAGMRARLAAEGDATRFTLGPEATTKALVQALTAHRPRPRYRVTTPTSVFWYLKRILPTTLLDKLLNSAGN
ncbi:SDR family NAD(P)-dependent oxidoreductase [Chitinibacteraceae bacterium HSL-7]